MAHVTSILATIDESARRRFEEAWRAGGSPDLAAFLPSPESQYYLPTLEELVHIDLEFRWRAAGEKTNGDAAPPERHLLEHYLSRFPPLSDPVILRRLIDQERRVRSRAGEKPSAEEYATRFPNVNLAGAADTLDSSQGDDSNPTGLTPAGHSKTMIGTARIPGYDILEVLGRGGIGVVYKARQVRLNRLVAVKMLLAGVHAGSEERARFQREAEAVARLTHPHIVQVYEVGETEGRLYIVFEFLPGGNLAQKLAGTPLAAEEAAALVATLADAVQHAHSHGVIHRDLKPTNVMLTLDGASKIGDFGLAKQLTEDQGATRTGDILGTPSYMAPEQASGRIKEIGPPTDVYALGAILYEVVTGRPPFRAETAWETLSQVLATDPVTPRQLAPRLPTDLETICLKCLEKEPAKRYPTALELADDLRRFLAHEPIVARPASAPEKLWRWCLRNPALSTAAALLVLLLLGATGGALGFGLYQRQVAHDLQQERDRTAAALAQSNRLSADLLCDRALGYCERGDVDLGILWMQEAYALTTPRDADLRRVLRANLAAWSQQFGQLREVHRFEGVVPIWLASPSGRLLVTGHMKPGEPAWWFRLWDVATGKTIGQPIRLDGPLASQLLFDPTEKFYWLNESKGKLSRVDTQTGERKDAGFSLPAQPLQMAASPNGEYLALVVAGSSAAGPAAKEVRIVSAQDGRAIGEPVKLAGSVSVMFQPLDGSLYVATALPPGPPPIPAAQEMRRYRLPEMTPLHDPWPVPAGRLVVSPRGTHLAFLGADDAVFQLDVVRGQWLGFPQAKPRGSRLVSTSIKYSFDGRWLAASSGTEVTIYNTVHGGIQAMFRAHDGEVASLAFAAEADLLVTAGLDGTIRLWNPNGGQPIGVALRCGNRSVQPFVCCDAAAGALLVGGQGNTPLESWDIRAAVASQGIALPFPTEAWNVAFAPDAPLALIVAGVPPLVSPAEERTEELKTEEAPPAPVPPGTEKNDMKRDDTVIAPEKPAKAPESNQQGVPAPLLVPGGPEIPGDQKVPESVPPAPPTPAVPTPTDQQPSDLHILTLDGAPRFPPATHPARITAIAFRPGEVVTGASDGLLRRWSLAAGTLIGRPLTLDEPITAVALSGNGRVLAAGGEKGRIRRWLASDGSVIAPDLTLNDTPSGPVVQLALDREGTLLVATGDGRYGSFGWRLAGKMEKFPLLGGTATRVAVLSPDARTIVTNSPDPVALVYDTATGKIAGERIPHSYPLFSAAFSPDDQLLATGSGVEGTALRGEVRLFRADTREPIGVPLAHPSPVKRLAFDAGGRLLFSYSYLAGGDHGLVRVWDVATGKPIGPGRREAGDTVSAALRPAGDAILTGGSAQASLTFDFRNLAPTADNAQIVIRQALGMASKARESTRGEAHLWPLPPPLDLADELLADWTAYVTRRRLNSRGLPEMLDDATWEAARAAVMRAGRSGHATK